MTSFADLKLSEKTLHALDRAGFEAPTPIQAQAIPPALAERSCRSLAGMMLAAGAWSALFTFVGLDLSYRLNLTFEKVQDLRYGENPHQLGAFYTDPAHAGGSISAAHQIAGKDLSFNNLLDLARMEAGKTRLRYQPVELHGLLTSLMQPFWVMAAAGAAMSLLSTTSLPSSRSGALR